MVIWLAVLFAGCAGLSATASYWIFRRIVKGDKDYGDDD